MLWLPASLAPILPLIYAGVILAITWVAGRLVGALTRSALRGTIPQVATGLGRVATIIVWVTGGILAVNELGVSTVILLLMVGLAGIAVVVGMRGPLENLGSKYLSDIYLPYNVGDTVQVIGTSGKVIEINAMCTILLSDDDRLVSVPNSVFLREVVVNSSPFAWKKVLIPISVPGGVDLALLESEVRKSLAKMRNRLDARYPPVLSTRAKTSTATDMVLTLMIGRPEDRDAITAEANKRLAETLKKIQGVKL